jgi:predicted short-subunit dehydrogenase-like oxidoreductase (DUF2520 family)
VQIAAGSKPLYHAAASFAAGHVLAVEEASARLLMLSGMHRNEAVHALLQLTRQVLENFERLGPRTAWTGPLARGDRRVIAAHLAAMKPLPPQFSKAYTSLNDLALLLLSADSSGASAGPRQPPLAKFMPSRARSSGGKV